MFLVLARSMSPAAFGTCVIWFNVASFLAVVAVGGQELLIVRSLNEYLHAGRPDLARGALRFGFSVCLCGSLLGAVGVAGAAWSYGLSAGALVPLALLVVATTLTLFTSQVTRVLAGIPAGTVHRELTSRLLVIAAALAVGWTGAPVSQEWFFTAAAIGQALAAGLQLRSIRRHLPRAVPAGPAAFRIQEWRGRSLRNWGAALVEASSQYLDVVVIGLVLSPAEAAAFFVASKIAGVFSIASNGTNLYAIRQIPALFFAGERDALQAKLALLSGATALVVLAGLTVALVGGPAILGLFGAAYSQHSGILLALCLGSAATALGGPAPFLLMTTGEEGRYLAVVVAGQLVRQLAIVALAVLAGLEGAVLAYALAVSGTTLALNIVCRRRLRLDPSVFALTSAMRVWRG